MQGVSGGRCGQNMSEEIRRDDEIDGDGEDTGLKEARAVFERTEKISRRIGYVLLFGAGFAIFIPMVIGAITGVQDDEIWDPFTDLPVAMDDPELECVREAGDLMYLAGAHGEYEPRWEQRFRRWRVRCQDEEPQLYQLLTQTRERLRGDEALPELDE